ncbi:MAG: hypothetical protein JWM44_4536 [Bacilli bacterium]|nr:hypothetical protein [Bacilli bacterium]
MHATDSFADWEGLLQTLIPEARRPAYSATQNNLREIGKCSDHRMNRCFLGIFTFVLEKVRMLFVF